MNTLEFLEDLGKTLAKEVPGAVLIVEPTTPEQPAEAAKTGIQVPDEKITSGMDNALSASE